MERKTNIETDYIEISPATYSLLQQDGLESAVRRLLHIEYKEDMSKLVFSGSKMNTIIFKNWVLQKQICMKQKCLGTDHSVLEFLRSVECDEMSRDLFISHGITAVYTIENGDVVVTGSTEKALAEAEKRVNTVLATKTLTVEDQGVLKMPEWLDLIRRLEYLYNTAKITLLIDWSVHSDKLIVTGFRESVEKVSENIKCLIEKNTKIEKTVCVKSKAVVEFIKDRKSQDWQDFIKSDKIKVSFNSKTPCIKLSGESACVQPALTFFKSLADRLYTDTLIIKKPGAKEYFMDQGKMMLSMFVREDGFMVVLQEDDKLEEEDDFSQGSQSGNSSSCLNIHILQIGQLTLEVSSGDITKEKTDAIVNSSDQTFSHKSGVSKAILDGAGLKVEQEILQMVENTNYRLTEIVTSSGNLLCKEIIHIVGSSSPADIQRKVLSVLKLCENHRFTSVAFPALGTGQGGANPSDVADAMISAVIEFAIKCKPVHVKSVEFIIFQTSMLADFNQIMLKRAMKPKKGMTIRSKGKTILHDTIKPVVFELCGETPEDLSKASDLINSLMNQEHMNITIHDPVINNFSKEDLEILRKMEKELKVSVITEKKGQDTVIRLNGLTGFVQNAESRIRDMVCKVERNDLRKSLATLTSSIVKWQYQRGHSFKAFDVFTNCDLEEAFKHQTTSVQIKIESEAYDADIIRQVATKGRKQVKLKRVELKGQSLLPSNWEDMKGQSVVAVKLRADSKEYADVEIELKKSGLSINIIKIERVQNSALWRNYLIKKEELEEKNKHKNNERFLFHGTGADKTVLINNQGFNRSFAGMHGALYGNGTYFAVDSSYSAQGYSKPDAKGHKHMYLARVLVGDFTQGREGILTPPKKSLQGVDLYDSVTDKSKNPTMFVIFNDVQAYPEYLITFKKK